MTAATATAGAAVALDGAPLGVTPLDVTVPAAARSVQLRVELAGHRPWTQTVSLDAPIEREPTKDGAISRFPGIKIFTEERRLEVGRPHVGAERDREGQRRRIGQGEVVIVVDEPQRSLTSLGQCADPNAVEIDLKCLAHPSALNTDANGSDSGCCVGIASTDSASPRAVKVSRKPNVVTSAVIAADTPSTVMRVRRGVRTRLRTGI